jgi:hypothetical protein
MKKLALALAISGAFVAGAANAVYIDDFNSPTTPPAGHSASGGGAGSSAATGLPAATATGGTIGGARILNVIGPNDVATTSISVNQEFISTGIAKHAQGLSPGTQDVSSILWNAAGAGLGATPANGFDLTEAATQDAIQLNIVTIDVGGADLKFTVTDINGNASSRTLTNLTVGPFAFLYSAFAADTATAADFTKLTSILLTITARGDTDVGIDLIRTRQGTNVPVPGTLALFGAGLIGAAIRRRKAAAAA